jgi:hypothetical protein
LEGVRAKPSRKKGGQKQSDDAESAHGGSFP